MKPSRLVRYALGIAAGCGLLAGCAGGLAPVQQGGAGADIPAQLRARGAGSRPLFERSQHLDRSRSWMAPGAKKAKTLLYVADEDTGDVNVYSYPSGTLEGTLTGFNAPSGMCSNKAGDVYVLNGGGTTVEVFAHGASAPLRTLDLPGYPELNCSVDPTTGNLALGVLDASCGDCIAVFTDGQGTPATYEPSGQSGIPGCGYDNSGNLFCDAYGSDDKFLLFELPAGGSNVFSVSVGGAGSLKAGPVQWDGKYLAVGSGALGTIYQLQISPSNASVVGSTVLAGTGWVWQSWIAKTQGTKHVPEGTRIIAPTYAGTGGTETGYWKYPAGGNPTKIITGFYQPDGATLSTLKKEHL
jgi:hypothetical protein